MSKVTLNTIIADVLKINKGTAPIFQNNGMHCLGCPSASGESIKDACEVHGINADKLVKEINEFLDKVENI